MLSSALSWLTPGGRRRQGNPPVDEVVNEDAVAASSSSPSAVGIEQGQPSPALSADGDAPSRDSESTSSLPPLPTPHTWRALTTTPQSCRWI